jgi:enoyl-CoA hydratase
METLDLITENEFVLTVKLQRPEVRNAINSIMMRELQHLWATEIPQRSGLRCIILTGSGDKAFCAGADLKERQNISLETWRQQHLALQQAMLAQVACPIPIIAAVNGAAFGGGLELALACDFIYAANTATFAQSEVKLGLMPGAMGTQNLPRACGIRKAKELSFSGATFSAEQAAAYGIVNRVLEPVALMAETLKIANIIAHNAPFAVRQVKKAINASLTMDIAAGYRFELEAYQQLLPTKDRIEGIQAFNEKRQAIFTDE